MHRVAFQVSGEHPLASALQAANRELVAIQQATEIGNDGRARVCARRAVGEILQAVATDPRVRASHSLATLRAVEQDETLPVAVRAAARRLQTGPRDVAGGAELSSDPLADALTVIKHFVENATR